jgi:hypothetical protein
VLPLGLAALLPRGPQPVTGLDHQNVRLRADQLPKPAPPMTSPIKKDFAPASGLSRCGRASGPLSHRVAANLRARALAPVIREIWAEGFMSYNALSRELNRRQVQPLRSGKQWYPMTAGRVLVRLERTGLIRIRRRPRRGSLLDLALGE